MRRLVLASLLVFGIVGPVLAATTPEPRVALVIGNSAYADAPLANPVNDARLMADTLRGLGFEAHAVDLDTGAVVAAEESSSHSIDPANLGYHRGHNSRVCRRCPFVGPERWK